MAELFLFHLLSCRYARKNGCAYGFNGVTASAAAISGNLQCLKYPMTHLHPLKRCGDEKKRENMGRSK